jgi:hypothetical protein
LVLFPLALVGGLVGLILGIIALARGKNRGATNTGQAIAGVVCCALGQSHVAGGGRLPY